VTRVVIAALSVATAALALTASGHGTESAGRLVWAAAPRHVAGAIVTGEVRNDGRARLRLDPARARVLDARGRALPATARFLDAYVPGRAGLAIITLAPGRTAPLTVAWRGAAARLAVGGATLALQGDGR
jgi:hypothetical protein